MTPFLLALVLVSDEPPVEPPDHPDWLSGVVLADDGTPVEGATVDAYSWVPGDTTTTGPDGRFELRDIPTDGDPVRFLITAPGRSPVELAEQMLGEDVAVTLGDDVYIEGRVTDLDGSPAAGATVTGHFPRYRGRFRFGTVVLTTTTDADGRYRLYGLPGEIEIQAKLDGVGVASMAGLTVKTAARWDATLLPGVRFEARVIDSETSEPVEGFVLYRWQKPILSAVSDADGRLVLEGLFEGRMEFDCGGGRPIIMEDGRLVPAPDDYDGLKTYLHGPFGRWWSPDAVVEWQQKPVGPNGQQGNIDGLTFEILAGMRPVTIEVQAGVTVTGRVTDPDGKPVEGATVAPAETGTGNSITGDTRYSVRTDADGRYEVVLPASGDVPINLIAHDGGYREWRRWSNARSQPFTASPGETFSSVDLQLTRPAIVRGRVVGGAAGIDVRAIPSDGRSNRYYVPQTQTLADGSFELRFVSPGESLIQYGLIANPGSEAEGTTQTVTVNPGEELDGVTLRMP